MESVLVAIDPGHDTGVAVFRQGRLSVAMLSKPALVKPQGHIDRIVVEVPQMYRGSRVDPGDLITLAFHAGIAAGTLAEEHTVVTRVKPREWKGQTPKGVMNKRVLERLTPEERAVLKTTNHNVLDAVGIGLWYLRRL